ncbi:MAG TPA: hypothetical protein VLE44_02110 [Candidatus Saccharimonadales bacterium]|nr:hypothetical protein [Candidatus Saccharimonadales bacterium]
MFINSSEEDISKKVKELQAKPIEFVLSKIEDVRELFKFTKLKLTEKTAILVKNFSKTSEEAQNAFLKSLEEPQTNLYYILTASEEDGILPTIMSRCEVIYGKLINTGQSISEHGNFFEKSVGEKLKTISIITKRDEAILFANSLISTGHDEFLKNYDMAKFLKEAQNLKRNLEANGNVQLQLTNFVVNLNGR